VHTRRRKREVEKGKISAETERHRSIEREGKRKDWS